MPYADSIKIQFDNPIGFVGALVGGGFGLIRSDSDGIYGFSDPSFRAKTSCSSL